jgi:hypothetical protein
MGRPVGSMNRERPVRDLLRLAVLTGGGRRLRVIVEKLLERAEGGDLQAIREVFDRLDGRPIQAIERGNVSAEVLSDRELFAIIRGGSRDPVDEPDYLMIAGPKKQ